MDVEMKALLSPAVTPYNYALQSRTSLPCHEVLSYYVTKHFLTMSRSTSLLRHEALHGERGMKDGRWAV